MVVNSAMVALCPTMLDGFSAAVYRDSSTEISHSERFRVRCTLNRSPPVLNTTPCVTVLRTTYFRDSLNTLVLNTY